MRHRVAPLLAVALLVTACSSSTTPEITGTNGEDPDFTGPWAAEFSSFYTQATSDLERQILADEQITEAEVAQMRSAFTRCLEDLGFTDIRYADDGGFSLTPPSGVEPQAESDLVQSCSAASGEQSIGALHSWITRNPENQDENAIMVSCLIREGAVSPAYTAEEFEADNLAGIAGSAGPAIPYLVNQAEGDLIFSDCNADPLGILG